MQRSPICYLIDDDKDEGEIFTLAIIESYPHISMHLAKSGTEAIQQLTKTNLSPDIVFLDLNMPKMNGLECLKALRANSVTAALPIVIYSTSKSPSDKEHCLKAGATAYLVKPYSFNELKQSLDELFLQHLQGVLI